MLKQIAINLKQSRADPQLPQAGHQDFKEHLAKNPRNPSEAIPDFIPFSYGTCPTYKIRSHPPQKNLLADIWKIHIYMENRKQMLNHVNIFEQVK